MCLAAVQTTLGRREELRQGSVSANLVTKINLLTKCPACISRRGKRRRRKRKGGRKKKTNRRLFTIINLLYQEAFRGSLCSVTTDTFINKHSPQPANQFAPRERRQGSPDWNTGTSLRETHQSICAATCAANRPRPLGDGGGGYEANMSAERSQIEQQAKTGRVKMLGQFTADTSSFNRMSPPGQRRAVQPLKHLTPASLPSPRPYTLKQHLEKVISPHYLLAEPIDLFHFAHGTIIFTVLCVSLLRDKTPGPGCHLITAHSDFVSLCSLSILSFLFFLDLSIWIPFVCLHFTTEAQLSSTHMYKKPNHF